MPNLLGIDVGLTLKDPTSGICSTGDAGFVLTHTFIDKRSRVTALPSGGKWDVLAIDGPVLAPGPVHYQLRGVECLFAWGTFQTRCKPGFSQVARTGQGLRRGGCDTAEQFEQETLGNGLRREIPRVYPGKNIVEAFPNAFLGILLDDMIYEGVPELQRGEKFSWLLEGFRARTMSAIKQHLNWPHEGFWRALAENNQHDEQAGLVCALTAICVWQGSYTAVGDPHGGYFFLPPWQLWQQWAKDALNVNRARLERAGNTAQVWIDGDCYSPSVDLPS